MSALATDLSMEGNGWREASFGTGDRDLVSHFCPRYGQYGAGVSTWHSEYILLPVLQQSQADWKDRNRWRRMLLTDKIIVIDDSPRRWHLSSGLYLSLLGSLLLTCHKTEISCRWRHSYTFVFLDIQSRRLRLERKRKWNTHLSFRQYTKKIRFTYLHILDFYLMGSTHIRKNQLQKISHCANKTSDEKVVLIGWQRITSLHRKHLQANI